MTFSSFQLSLLGLLTVVWGLNWPVMKLGVSADLPPLFFLVQNSPSDLGWVC
jgi:predicted TIM-barrel fold metal-dependent hydrolase